MLTIFFSMSIVFAYSKVVYDDVHKQAPRGKIAATRYVSEPQKCPKMRLRPGLHPDPAGGAYSAFPDPLAGNGGEAPPPGKGEGKRGEGREGEGTGGKARGEMGRATPPE